MLREVLDMCLYNTQGHIYTLLLNTKCSKTPGGFPRIDSELLHTSHKTYNKSSGPHDHIYLHKLKSSEEYKKILNIYGTPSSAVNFIDQLDCLKAFCLDKSFILS